MLSAKYRLSKNELARVFRGGKHLRGKSLNFIVQYVPVKEKKIGIVIASKTLKLAVERNRMKRKLRHLAKEYVLPKMPLERHLVIYTSATTSKFSQEELLQELQKLSSQIR